MSAQLKDMHDALLYWLALKSLDHENDLTPSRQVAYTTQAWHIIRMPKRKRRRDLNQLAKFIVDVSTGNADSPKMSQLVKPCPPHLAPALRNKPSRGMTSCAGVDSAHESSCSICPT
jgi:hypothetical protein